ncbi:type 2 isopentenyl-diphosphate Delta-isomerase [Aureibacillus halotolerans]|uniref:Isopentenyl-diphosphate delta-isomerase n=1 Tax=Aureibacillus halotolerans TaxID=1508390 RepID=A0A4R6UEL9_9BACI|nr:type 2 isopentenyl-diphosphate Delta-isomerase [Aureibacillus halotolerans]TDQ41544.1 isopentenyl-diphosphate delta-isomerase [Aureibacillus halotolerans]
MNREQRKLDHIQGALTTGFSGNSGFDCVTFVHQSLPKCDVADISLQTEIGELTLSSPLFINAMTGGGGNETFNVNQRLARIAKETGIAMAVGSQMAAVKDERQARTYRIVREENPDGVLFANLGMDATVHQALMAIDMIEANALQIHLNVIQELVMPEGDREFSRVLHQIEAIVKAAQVPVIVKEVGFGMSWVTARALHEVGVSAVDVGGFGGTNFSKIENSRRTRQMTYFNDWGIPTAFSLAELRLSGVSLPVLGSGGINDPLAAVKSFSLGASAVGIAGFALRTLHDSGDEELLGELNNWSEDFKMIMTALGAKNIAQMKNVPLVVKGDLYHWLTERGFNTKRLAATT